MQRCCFTGHRTLPPQAAALTEKLDRTLLWLYREGVREFRTGGARGFDTLAALRVLTFRESHPDCRLALFLPCGDQSSNWETREQLVYDWIREKADTVTVLFERYCPECMHMRNRALVNGSDICVAFLTQNSGGTLYTCSYALKQGVRLYNLATDKEPPALPKNPSEN